MESLAALFVGKPHNILLVRITTPEANIRVDLLLIWPILAILSAWAFFRALR
jgi:hypothetical protein